MDNLIELRKQYKPSIVKYCFIFESPPAHGGYFYDPAGRIGELLFRSLMETCLGSKFSTKDEGLRAFQSAGFYLVNPIYTPVNKLRDADADRIILAHYESFKQDLLDEGLKYTPLILVKANIWKLLKGKLVDDGFTVLNLNQMLPFPMHYHFQSFKEKLQALLKKS